MKISRNFQKLLKVNINLYSFKLFDAGFTWISEFEIESSNIVGTARDTAEGNKVTGITELDFTETGLKF